MRYLILVLALGGCVPFGTGCFGDGTNCHFSPGQAEAAQTLMWHLSQPVVPAYVPTPIGGAGNYTRMQTICNHVGNFTYCN